MTVLTGAVRLLLGSPSRFGIWVNQPDGGPDGMHNAEHISQLIRNGDLLISGGRIAVVSNHIERGQTMAYVSRDLSVLAYANGFTLWHYVSTDAATVVDATGYFNAACDMLRVGDIIIANVDTAGTPQAGLLLVSKSDGGEVVVSNMTNPGSADGTAQAAA